MEKAKQVAKLAIEAAEKVPESVGKGHCDAIREAFWIDLSCGRVQADGWKVTLSGVRLELDMETGERVQKALRQAWLMVQLRSIPDDGQPSESPEPKTVDGGLLVVLEGIDGSGKTTQRKLIAGQLRELGYTVHETAQPSGGPIGQFIRQVLSSTRPTEGRLDNMELALLFAADRAYHLRAEVEPALDRGEIVVCDRWYYSSVAYQARTPREASAILKLNRNWMRKAKRWIEPDLVLFLAVDRECARTRRKARGGSSTMLENRSDLDEAERNYTALFKDLVDTDTVFETILDCYDTPEYITERCMGHVKTMLESETERG